MVINIRPVKLEDGRNIVKWHNVGFKDNPKIHIIPAPYAHECSYHL